MKRSGEIKMAIIEKYYLYRPDGTEEIKVEKRESNLNIVKSLTGAHFSDESKKMTVIFLLSSLK